MLRSLSSSRSQANAHILSVLRNLEFETSYPLVLAFPHSFRGTYNSWYPILTIWGNVPFPIVSPHWEYASYISSPFCGVHIHFLQTLEQTFLKQVTFKLNILDNYTDSWRQILFNYQLPYVAKKRFCNFSLNSTSKYFIELIFVFRLEQLELFHFPTHRTN